MKKSRSKIEKARLHASSLSSLAIRDRVLDLAALTRGNFRNSFSLSDIVTLARALKPFAKAAAKINQCAHGGTAPGRKSISNFKITSRDLIADACGLSSTSLRHAEAVVKAAEDSPARFGNLVFEMDRTGNIDGVFRHLTRRARIIRKKTK